MDYTKILKRSWDIVWKYRSLWLFGILLAFTTSSGLFGLGILDRDNVPRGITVKVTQDSTIYLPGEGLSIDFTSPDGVTVFINDGEDFREVWSNGLLLDDVITQDVGTVIIIGLIWLALLVILVILARNVSRAALISMVDQGEQTGESPGLMQGLKAGFSRYGWRLFSLDLLVFLFWVLVLSLMVLLVAAPLMLLTTESTIGKVIGIAAASGIFFLFLALAIMGGALLSLFVEIIRRACVQDDLGVFAGIRSGVVTVFRNFSSLLVVWLIWIGVRLIWFVAAIPIMLLLTPVFLLMILIGALVAGFPALITAGLASLFLSGIWPWVVAGMIAVPIFIFIVGIPLAFVGGLVEIYKSNLWTLSYRDLRPSEKEVLESSKSPDIQEQPMHELEASSTA